MKYSDKRIYLAGPDVFLPNAIEIGEKKKEICARYDFEGAFPLDNELALDGLEPNEMGIAIYDANVDVMESSAFVIANMTPFRGPSMDVGTAHEMGHMRGLKRPVLGYRNTTETYAQRIFHFFGEKRRHSAHPEEGGHVTDPKGVTIENFGLGDNLMVDCSVIRSGFVVIEKKVPHNEHFTNLEAFKRCVELLYEYCSTSV